MSKIMKKTNKINYYKFPDKHGRFGKFGGRFVAETLMPLLLDVEKKYKEVRRSKKFKSELSYYFENYVGRPSPLYFAKRISKEIGDVKVYFKRDELNHTGAHKINNCVGQVLLAKKMGKKELLQKQALGNMDLQLQLSAHFLT